MPAPLPVFSVLPNWSSGVLERIGYQTDVQVSESGREHRRSTRRYPRRKIEATFDRHRAIRQRLENFVIGIRKNPFYVPLWFEQHRPTVQMTSGNGYVQFPVGSLVDREFRTDDWVIIIDRDPNFFETHQITSINHFNGRINFPTALANTWPLGARVIPLRKARLLAYPGMSMRTDEIGSMTLLFDLDDPDTFYGPAWGHCSPLFRFRPNRADPINIEYADYSLMLDNETGVPYNFEVTPRVRINELLNCLLLGRDNIVKFRRFLAAARGRQIRFWCPTFVSNVTLASDIDASTDIYIHANGLAEYLDVKQDARTMLSVIFDDSRPPIYREVLSIQPVGTDGALEKIVLALPCPPIGAAEVRRIEFVMPCRFDQDNFEIKHETDEGAIAKTSVVIRSSDIEDMPPIDCWVTSQPYAAVSVDQLFPSVTIRSGRLYAIRTIEGLDVAGTVVAGDFSGGLVTYADWPEENVEASASILSGSLTGGLESYEIPAEAIQATATLLSGVLEVALITYDDWPVEGLNVAATITGGTLV